MVTNFVTYVLELFLSTTLVTQTAAEGPPFVEDGYPIVIIGSGLAGHSAAAELSSILTNDESASSAFGDHKIIVIEKEEKFGGNSMKATSGINGAMTQFQNEQKIDDNLNDFTKDTTFSATNSNDIPPKDRYDLISQLAEQSSDAVNWLKNVFNLDLSKISQCGGHSHPRTHRPPKGPAGNIIVKTVHNTLETNPNIEFRYNTKAIELLTDEDSKTVIGVKVETTSKDDNNPPQISTIMASAVILASGGYGNDHSESSSLLDEYSLNGENNLPTTNGNWATGDGIKLGRNIGARLIDMSYIQIHPTGFINPKEPNSSTKFLAPEALRGSGGIMINYKGNRFVNELDLRSNVVKSMNNQKYSLYYLILNNQAAEIFGPNINFYAKFGLFRKYSNIEDFINNEKHELSDLSVERVKETFIEYSKIAEENNKDNNKVDQFGKNVFPVKEYNPNEEFYVAEITPVIHYTMGGLQMTKKTEILDENGDVMHGLFGAGEVTGGLHGMNRLAGNSLLECVVYGRIAGKSVIQYVKMGRERKGIQGGVKAEL